MAACLRAALAACGRVAAIGSIQRPPAAMRLGRAPPPQHPAAHLRRRERRGLFFARRHAADLPVHARGHACDQIFTMKIDGSDLQRVSTGTGRTTCGYFYPGGKDILFASTHKAGADCPPKPSYERGYVWPIYDGYDIYRANADGIEPAAADDHAGLRRGGDDRARRHDCVHERPRRRHGDLHDEGRRDGRPPPDAQSRARRRAVLLLGRQAHRLPRPAADAGHGADRLPGAAEGASVAPDETRALRDGSRRRERDGSITKLGAASFAPSWHPDGSG